MKRVLLTLALVVALMGCATTTSNCFIFDGQKYCPKSEEATWVLPCKSTSCLSERILPALPEPPVAPAPRVTAVVAPTDAGGKPAAYVNLCDQNGCSVRKAPVVIVEYPRPQPPTVWWYQPPPVAVPKVITWGPWKP